MDGDTTEGNKNSWEVIDTPKLALEFVDTGPPGGQAVQRLREGLLRPLPYRWIQGDYGLLVSVATPMTVSVVFGSRHFHHN